MVDDTGESQYSNNSTLKQRYPDVIIIGTPKSGTLALRKMLGVHTKIVEATNGDFNEIKFFSGSLFERGYGWYLSIMPEVRHELPETTNDEGILLANITMISS